MADERLTKWAKAELHNYSLNDGAQKSVGDILSRFLCDPPEDLLAILAADPPATVADEAEGPQDKHSLGGAKESVIHNQPGVEKG